MLPCRVLGVREETVVVREGVIRLRNFVIVLWSWGRKWYCPQQRGRVWRSLEERHRRAPLAASALDRGVCRCGVLPRRRRGKTWRNCWRASPSRRWRRGCDIVARPLPTRGHFAPQLPRQTLVPLGALHGLAQFRLERLVLRAQSLRLRNCSGGCLCSCCRRCASVACVGAFGGTACFVPRRGWSMSPMLRSRRQAAGLCPWNVRSGGRFSVAHVLS